MEVELVDGTAKIENAGMVGDAMWVENGDLRTITT